MIQGKQKFSSKRKKEKWIVILRTTFLGPALFLSFEDPFKYLCSKCWVGHQLRYLNPAFSLDKFHLYGSNSSAGHLEKSHCC